MAYKATTWATGDTISATLMNNIESGISNAALASDVEILTNYNTATYAYGNHNSIYRGKQIGTSFTSTNATTISGGTFADMYIGDYWTISSTNWRIGCFDYYYNCGDTNFGTHHAVIVPDTILYTCPMNPSNTTEGGYVGSAMFACETFYLDSDTSQSTAYTGLQDAKDKVTTAFGSSYVASHRAYLTNAVTSGYPSAGAWADVTVDLMNEQMVYGGAIRMPMGNGNTNPTNYRVEKSQLPLFALCPRWINIRADYWLRDVCSATGFAGVSTNGAAYAGSASPAIGVRPAFCLT